MKRLTNKHVYYFDYLRVIAAISVIYMHAASGPLRGTINMGWHFINILTCIGFTAVPLFFMMSGYLLLSNPKTEDIDYLLKKRIPRLLIPLAGWTVVALLWKLYNNRDISLFWDGLVESLNSPAWVHLWYVYTLIAIYLISPVICAALRSLNKKAHVLILVLICLASVRAILQLLLPSFLDRFLDVDIISKLTFFGGHLNTFILGYYIGNIKKRIPNWILLLSGGVILAVISTGTYYLTIKTGSFYDGFLRQSAGFEVLLAAIVFVFFKQNFNRESRILRVVPIIPLAFSIYLMHNILLSMMITLFPGAFTIKTLTDTILVTVINFVICFIVMKTVSTIKPICFLATGMSYKTACESCNWVFTYKKLKGCFDRRRNSKEDNTD